MILNLQNIYKDYQQEKLVVPVLSPLWDRPVPVRPR